MRWFFETAAFFFVTVSLPHTAFFGLGKIKNKHIFAALKNAA